MRLFALLAALPLSAALTHQAAFTSSPKTASLTIVDVLSQDPDGDYTDLLRLLQRAKLIPTLNRLNDSTFFAPTNDAIRRRKKKDPLWELALADDPPSHLLDNVNEPLRQQLLYHLLNYTVALPNNLSVLVTHTLHFPYVNTEPPTDQPPPRPPWMPVPGGALGGESQRLRLAFRDEKVRVGVDASGNGGFQVVKGNVSASNGVVVGIDGVLDVPSHLADVVASQPSLAYFKRILTPKVKDLLANTSELTLFVPVDAAFDALPKYERLFLESEFASEDLQRIFEMHAVVQDRVTYSEAFAPAVNLTTLHGQTLEVVQTPDKVFVSGAELVQADVYGANGVLHTVSSLLLPSGSLQLTPEKLLLTYNCSAFISMLHSVNLTGLVNDTSAKYTILAPQDDVIALFGDDGDLPEKGSDELRKALQYHFLPGKWTPDKLRKRALLETELVEDGLDGGRQVLPVEVTAKSGAASDAIRFGGASVVGDPLELNNSTIIYFLSRPLSPPADVLSVALPSLELSHFLAAVFSSDLADTLRGAHRTTLLVPRNAAFERLGALVSAHLLSGAGKADLRRVVLHHVLDDVLYAAALVNGSAHTFGTLEGSDAHLSRSRNGSLTLTGSGGWPGLSSTLHVTNALARTGVLHELSDVLLPRSVDLTLSKLARAAGGTTMASLVARAGMDWILNGTAPPPDSNWGRDGVRGSGWTLLVPADEAFAAWNLTALYEDDETLRKLVSQHLVRTPPPPERAADGDGAPSPDTPNANAPLALDDRAAYATLLSSESDYGDVILRAGSDGALLVGIKGARGTGARADWARVTAWGRATTGGDEGGGVLAIDRVLAPYVAPWWVAVGVPAAVGVLGLLAIAGFFALVRAVWRRDAREATYEPVGGFVNDDDDVGDT